MSRKIRLSSQVARPLVIGGAVFAVVVLVVLSVLYERSLARELASRASLLAAAAEQPNGLDESEQQLLTRLSALGGGSPRLEAAVLVDLAGARVLASHYHESSTGVAGRTGSDWLQPLAAGAHQWRLDGISRQVYSRPVKIPELGRDLRLVMLLDGKSIHAEDLQSLKALGLTIALGVLFLAFGASGMLRSRVLLPITQIKAAVDRRRRGEENVVVPKVRNDEIGQLAEVLESSLSALETLDDRLRLLSYAIQGSSNEVYIVDARTLRVSFANRAAELNLGYSNAELLQMSVPDVAHAMRDLDYAMDLESRLAPAGELRHSYVHTRKDGSEYPFEFTAIRVNQEPRRQLIVLGNDISDRERQDAALRSSEKRLQLAIEGSSDGVFDFDIEHGELYFSERVREWMTLPVVAGGTDALLDVVFSRLHADDLGDVRKAFLDCLHHGKDFDLEFRYQAVGTSGYRWLQVRGRGAWSDSGDLIRLSGSASDVSRRKMAENLIQDTVARLGAVLDNIAEGIITLDAHGLVCAVNPAGEQMLGCDRETLVAQPFSERLEIPAEGWKALADRQLRECVAVQASGETFPAEYAVSTLDIGSDEQYIVVFRDISERKNADAELHRALDEARSATKAKDEFLATMSHEIRTPMNGVLGMTQLLLDMDVSEEQRETARVIYSSGEALLTIINDILDFSKIEARKLEFEASPFDLRVAVGEVMELLAANVAVDLYVDYPSDVPSHLLGDVGRIRQVLMNLVGNALKFTERGHVLVRVEDLSPAGSKSPLLRSFARLKISVSDTGPGISPTAQAALFDSFTQADASTTRRYGGTGLGLAISKRLVELMGGEIGLVSEPGKGSTFYFTLNLPTYVEDHVNRLPNGLDSKRALVVEDNPVGQKIYQRALERAGVDVVLADSGAIALARIDDAGPFDFVVLDYHMPEMDGLELAACLRARADCAGMRLIMLSSSDIRGDASLQMLDGYGVKPVLQNTLYALIERALGAKDQPTKSVEVVPDDDESIGSAGHRVLLAEDNVVNQKVAVRMLEKLGCVVDVAANGVEAVAMWEQFPYAMVFMDCQMPDMDGLEATRQIRQLEMVDDRHTPIVAMTANAMPKDQEDCLAAGMDDYLAKPVKTGQVAATLERWITFSTLAGSVFQAGREMTGGDSPPPK